MGINEYGFMADACKWQALFLGTALSVMMGGGSGPVKLFPRTRNHQWMVKFFQNYIGPLFVKGRRPAFGDYIRYLIGFSEMLIGVVLFCCLWTDQMYTLFSAEAVDRSKTWCLCMGIVAHFLLGIQAVMNFKLNRKKVSVMAIMFGMNCLVLLLRLIAWPPWWLSIGNQWLFWTFSMLIPLPFVAAALVHRRWGVPLAELENMSAQDEFAEFAERSAARAERSPLSLT